MTTYVDPITTDPTDPTTADPTTVEPLYVPTATLSCTHADGYTEVLTAYTAKDVVRLIRKAGATPYVQKAKGGEGTGSLGLYVEAVAFTAGGTPFTHMKFFVVGDNVYAYGRNAGDSRANWKQRKTTSLEQSLAIVQAALDKSNVRLFGHPVLVELTADDLSAIEEGGMPPARFRGEYRIQREFGKYDFTIEVFSKALPASFVGTLRTGFFTDNT